MRDRNSVRVAGLDPRDFNPPSDWPNAKTEAALDAGYEALGALIAKTAPISPRDTAAMGLKREAVARMHEAKALLFQAYHAEMEARLALWRSAGYSL